jgi:hypothetical protein
MLTWSGITPSARLAEFLDILLTEIYKAPTAEGKLKLYQNNFTPGPGTKVADLVEADFSGYAPLDLADGEVSAARLDVDGNAFAVDTILRTFEQDADTITNAVYGYFVTNDPGTVVYTAGRFATPIAFSDAGASLDLELGYRLDFGGLLSGTDATVGFPPP